MAGRVLNDVLADLFLAATKQHIVLGKVGMPEHVCGDQDVVGQGSACGKISVAGITGKDYFEQARIAHVPLHQRVDVARPEGPMRHTHRQTIDRYLAHETVGHGLEDDRREFEP